MRQAARHIITNFLPAQGTGVQIGASDEFSAAILKAATPSRLYVIGPDEESGDAAGAEGTRKRDKRRPLVLNDPVVVQPVCADAALAQISDCSVDFIYLVGGASDEARVSTLALAAFDKLRPGGVICATGYSTEGSDGVVRSLHEIVHTRSALVQCVLGDQIVVRKNGGPVPGAASSEAFRNQLEIQVFGLRRSGNHAVIGWIAQQFEKPITFLNNVVPFEDPFTSFRFGRVPNALPARKRERLNIERLRSVAKPCILISYEDVSLEPFQREIPQWSEWVGESRATRRILLLRDFYNWLSSRVRLTELKTESDGEDLLRRMKAEIGRWLAYAREFVGETSFLEGVPLVRLNFKSWSEIESYRAGILDELQIPIADNSRSTVPKAGGGSSFDGQQFSGAAEAMDISSRWKYLTEEKYADLLRFVAENRPDIDRYNEQIFGLVSPFDG